GDLTRVQVSRHPLPIEPGRADQLEWRVRATSHGNVSCLKQANARIQSGFSEAAHVRRGIDPSEVSGIEPHRSPPTLHTNDAQIGADLSLLVVKTREFTNRHAMTHGNHVVGRERKLVAVRQWPFNVNTVDWIWSVQNENRKLYLRRFFQNI